MTQGYPIEESNEKTFERTTSPQSRGADQSPRGSVFSPKRGRKSKKTNPAKRYGLTPGRSELTSHNRQGSPQLSVTDKKT